MADRPVRVCIINELGLAQTLPDDFGQFEIMGGGRDVVFLGLGPDPAKLAELFPEYQTAHYVESPAMASQIEPWDTSVPSGFSRMQPADFTQEIAGRSTLIRYRPGLKAFPSFWGPLTARAAVSRFPVASMNRTVWLPLGENALLGKELALSFAARGYGVRFVDQEALERSPGTALPELFKQGVPELFFSVNFKGLEPFGLGYHILREAGVTVGIWLVDNPFNMLTSLKSAYWQKARLFVTDHSFIGPLIASGANWVTHLPLAACPELFATGGALPEHGQGIEKALVFVGRSEFPKKAQFFAGLTPDQVFLDEAVEMLDRGERPDFHWWRERVPARLWPGNEIRNVGIGAEVAGYAWRVRCLAAAGRDAVIFGDVKWGDIEEITAEVRPLLDYYAGLPAVYRTAAVSLNVTGMQLPAGLTQRHFDVWCAGGFLITDANPGLGIFPKELVEAVTYTVPGDIGPMFARYRDESDEKRALRAAWREVILRDHTYANRVATILKTLGLS